MMKADGAHRSYKLKIRKMSWRLIIFCSVMLAPLAGGGAAPELQLGPFTTNGGIASVTLAIVNGGGPKFYMIDRATALGSNIWNRTFYYGQTNFSVPIGAEQSMFFRALDIQSVFQFAIFYNLDLEIDPGVRMTVTGPVHCNSTNYIQPGYILTFQSDVTSVGPMIFDKKPGDPSIRSGGTVIFLAHHQAGMSTINLLPDTNNSPAAVREIVEVPPVSESPDSPLGQQRLYNKADLIILVSNNTVVAKSGLLNNFGTIFPASQVSYFVNTNAVFFNKRENKTILATEVDITKLRAWDATNFYSASLPAGDVRTVYVADFRSQTSSTESGVRLMNGQTVLPKGLTVATPNPVYIRGNYNAPAAALGTTNTSGTVPCAIIADAVTILSPNWSDANSGLGLSLRTAADCTVNAALLAGIVQTGTNTYSGGWENFPRFVETWAGRTFTFNGSMVALYESKFATGLWLGTGSTLGIYNPPTRNWAFDQNFRDPTKLPPSAPLIRGIGSGVTP